MNWTSSNLTVRVGCRIAYETSMPTPRPVELAAMTLSESVEQAQPE